MEVRAGQIVSQFHEFQSFSTMKVGSINSLLTGLSTLLTSNQLFKSKLQKQGYNCVISVTTDPKQNLVLVVDVELYNGD